MLLTVLIGWLSTLAWQTGTASASYIIASQIQALLLLNDASYEFQRWHGTLLVIATASLATICNCVLVKQLPKIEIFVLILYFAGFFGIVITLWVLAPKTPAHTVFKEFQNNGGWPNQGLSVLIGMTGSVYTILGIDCGVHLGTLLTPSLPIPALSWVLSHSRTHRRRSQRLITDPATCHCLVFGPQCRLRIHHDSDFLLLSRRH